MEARWDVLGMGVAAVDDLIYVDRYPQPDTKVAVRERHRQGGGLTATAMVAAARLGARAAYGGVLGRDELSRYTIQELERDGVDCAPVLLREEAEPCHSAIIVDRSTGSRTILYAADRVMARRPEDLTSEWVGCGKVLFLDSTAGYGGLHAVELARALGIPVVGDIERFTVPGTEELLWQIDHLIVGVELARQVTGEAEPERMVRALSSDGRLCAAVTAGDRGCWYAERGGAVHHQPAYQVEVVDTTGCGDVFHGAYAACIARGDGVGRAIQVAAATAAIKATRPGGRAGIPDAAAVAAFIRQRET
jgi:sulfofructose kinase